ncbi:MAG: ABC transporter permease subunit [Phycisphaera sp.]|nr:ABC transporter permease subunit [Phycisphaera sp.]
MANYIIRRLILLVPTLLGMTFVVFMIMALSPGGIGGSLLNDLGELDSQQSRAIRQYYENRYGINQPVIVQYVKWLNLVSPVGFRSQRDETGKPHYTSFGFKWPDLGESMAKHRPVSTMIAEALPITLLLNLITTPIVYILAILMGIYAARYRGKMLDVGLSTSMLALWSLPTIMIAVLLIGFLANRDNLHWFPPGGFNSVEAHTMAFLPHRTEAGFERGWLLDRGWHLVLPVLCMLYGSFAWLMKLMRSSLLENLSADFVRTARAKGLSDNRVLWGHAFRNSLLPLITVLAGVLPGLLAGSVVIEKIFSLPGMGNLAIEAINARDREVVLATTLISGLLSLLCILVADLLYTLADPRVSYE